MEKGKQSKGEWDLGGLFKNDDDPAMLKERKAVEKANHDFISKWKKREDYLADSKALKEALDELEKIGARFGTSGNEGYYFWLRTNQDQADPALKARMNKIEESSKNIENDMQFFTLKLAKIPAEKQKEFLAAKELSDYRHFLKKLFEEAKYLLSEEGEKIMNLKSTSSYSNWVKMTSEFLSKEEREVLCEDGKTRKKNFSELLGMLDSTKKKVRDSAAAAFNDILLKNSDVAENELNSVLQDKKANDMIRNMPRPDLGRHLGDDIETEIVDELVRTISKRFGISRRYYALKAKLLGVKKLKYHERNVPYGKAEKKRDYGEASELVSNVLNGLDSEFGRIFSDFSRNGQIDAFPKKGKESGAFCVHWTKMSPTYILLNHSDSLHDVLTLAHELGHGINNELAKKNQNSFNYSPPTSTAEVASTFMEDFVLRELEQEADDELRLALMMMKLNGDVSTIFRQIAGYMFEMELHEEFRKKGYLSKKEIGALFLKHMDGYMGDAVEKSAGSENWWVYWSHIRSYFYNYSYASGLLISKFMQMETRKDPKFILKVKEFLSAGSHDSPRNIFMKMGVDISKREFWNEGLDEVEALLHETEKLAKKLGRI